MENKPRWLPIQVVYHPCIQCRGVNLSPATQIQGCLLQGSEHNVCHLAELGQLVLPTNRLSVARVGVLETGAHTIIACKSVPVSLMQRQAR